MSVTDWKLEKGLCRCCHAEGAFKNLSVPCYKHDGEEEIYVDMIRDHMNVEIIQVQGSLHLVTFTICDMCIAKLRDVTTFRRQVMSCEKRFQDMYSRNVFKVGDRAPDVKVEVIDVDDFGDIKGEDDDDDDFTMNFSDEEDIKAEMLIDIKQEPTKKNKGKGKATAKAKKRPAAKRPSRAKKGKKAADDGDEGDKGDGEQGDEAEATASLADTAKKASKKVFVSPSEYRTENRNKHTCVQCGATSTTLECIKRHIKIAHYGWLRYLCDVCPDGFKSSRERGKHMLEKHGIDRRHACMACDAKFWVNYQLKYHMDRYHKQGKLFKCDLCEYQAHGLRKSEEKHHTMLHSTEKNLKCSFCNKKFKSKNTWHQHEAIHTKRNMKQCPFCTESFVQRASLKYHLEKYHPNQV